MKRIIIFVGALLLISLSACEKYTIKPEENNNVSFSADIQPIFTKNCAGCHNGTGTNDGGLALNLSVGNAYTELMTRQFIDTAAPASSILYVQMASSSHSYYSNQANRAEVLSWIEQGALDN